MIDIEVDIRKRLKDGRRSFSLAARFESQDDFVVLFGPSGSGKSITLQAIAGLLTPDHGRICVGGRVLFDAARGVCVSVQQRRVGYLFQDYALFPHLTVAQNIALPLSPWSILRTPAAVGRRVAAMLDVFELTPLADALPRDLSGGQRQRTALARALVRQPDVLLLDEPFAALNPLLRARMRTELLRIQDHFRVPVLLITHDHDDVATFGETLVMYDQGAVQKIVPFKRMVSEQAVPADLARLLAALEPCQGQGMATA